MRMNKLRRDHVRVRVCACMQRYVRVCVYVCACGLVHETKEKKKRDTEKGGKVEI